METFWFNFRCLRAKVCEKHQAKQVKVSLIRPNCESSDVKVDFICIFPGTKDVDSEGKGFYMSAWRDGVK
jgi:hypothetical protein